MIDVHIIHIIQLDICYHLGDITKPLVTQDHPDRVILRRRDMWRGIRGEITFLYETTEVRNVSKKAII